jgi:hypothetical protein
VYENSRVHIDYVVHYTVTPPKPAPVVAPRAAVADIARELQDLIGGLMSPCDTSPSLSSWAGAAAAGSRPGASAVSSSQQGMFTGSPVLTYDALMASSSDSSSVSAGAKRTNSAASSSSADGEENDESASNDDNNEDGNGDAVECESARRAGKRARIVSAW